MSVEERVEELLKGHRDAITVKRVFGEPLQQNGVTVIPAANVMGGGGGGSGEGPDGAGQGSGTGFGIAARPAGAYVIRGNEVSWQPAVDLNRIAAGVLVYLVLRILLGRRKSRRQK
jgi:uncharacterized spore protein YtfJ